MIVGLIGFELESPNKGCEALGYSFLSTLLNETNNIELIYIFSSTGLGSVPEYFNKVKFFRVNPRIKDLRFRFLRALKKCDVIFDVTMGDSFSDIYSLDYYKRLIRFKRAAEIMCKKYILLPQTYGPFENSISALKAKKVFDRAFKIYCRDEISQKLLKNEFKVENSILTSDMAFTLPYDKDLYEFSEKEKIGINISGLLYKGGFYKKNQFGLSIQYSEIVEKLIVRLSDKYEVHLIPHVIDQADNAYDDDYKICMMLQKKYSNTIMAPAFNTPIQAKSYISNMSIFIGSRMHATIAAFSSGVVTIPISYSRKFEGLFGSLDYPYVVNATIESTDSAYKKVVQYIDKKEELIEAQNKSIVLIHKKNSVFKNSISQLLKEFANKNQ